MDAFLETKVGKFTFLVDTTCFFTGEGVWIRVEGNRARLGLSDYMQQHSGDMAFVEVKPEGTNLAVGDEFSTVETIKVDLSLSSPVAGKILVVNPALEGTPEIVNQDPYGEGWLCELEITNWDSDRAQLLNPSAYFTKMKHDAEEEVKPK